MATLHTVNKSPYASTTMLSCLSHCVVGDSVLLLEDGVYGAVKGSKAGDTIAAMRGQLKLYALGPDLSARGIAASRLVEGVEVVDYAGFVDLVTSHKGTQAWL
jgi:tRNA 2-thiouridine synthesizing protein B